MNIDEGETHWQSLKDSDADQDTLFAQSIAVSLGQMDPQKRSLAKIKMQQALHEVEFGDINPTSTT